MSPISLLLALALGAPAAAAGPVVLAGAPVNNISVSASGVVQCGTATVSWSNTVPPVTLDIGTGGYYVGMSMLDSIPGIDGTSASWKVDQAAGSNTLIFRVTDATGAYNYVQNVKIGSSDDDSCLAGSGEAGTTASPTETSTSPGGGDHGGGAGAGNTNNNQATGEPTYTIQTSPPEDPSKTKTTTTTTTTATDKTVDQQAPAGTTKTELVTAGAATGAGPGATTTAAAGTTTAAAAGTTAPKSSSSSSSGPTTTGAPGVAQPANKPSAAKGLTARAGACVVVAAIVAVCM